MQDSGLGGVVAVIVTFDPVLEEVERLLERLVPELRQVVVVDNSGPPASEAVRAVVERTGGAHHWCGSNLGIAAAQNIGMRTAIRAGATAVLLLDDDSSIGADDVATLLGFLMSSRASDPSVAAVAPRIVDERTKEELNPLLRDGRLVHGAVTEVTDAAFLLGSGTLLHVQALERHGYFRDEYFIDHVDKEWGYRVRSQGGRLLITPRVALQHRLGNDPVLRNGKWVTYSQSNPARHYYMARNSLLLMRDVRLPRRERFHEAVSSGRFIVRRLLSPDQPVTVKRAVLAGFVEGVRGRRTVGYPRSRSRRRGAVPDVGEDSR